MNLGKMKIADLRKELKDRGLATSGNKSELAARLKDALTAEGADPSHQEEDLDAKESELLGEEEDEDIAPGVDLDTKLLEASTAPAASAPPPAKQRKIVINREAAETAQQAAASAIAQADAAPPPPPAAPTRIRLSSTEGLTETERLARRSEKLGGAAAVLKPDSIKMLTMEERKAARLAKFGGATDAAVTPAAFRAGKKNGADPTADLEKLKKRADRFGEAVSNKVVKLEESERLQKRKERFGMVLPEEVKAKRAARFSSSAPIDPVAEEKRRLRAARFGTT